MKTDRGGPAARTVEEELGPVLEFMRVLWAVNHGLETMSKRMKRRIGITGRERVVIRLVGNRPGISAGDLARILHVHPSSLTALLERLVSRRLLLRSVHPEDGRRAVLTLTRRGCEVDRMRTGTIEARVQEALGRIATRDARTAVEVLTEIASTLSR